MNNNDLLLKTNESEGKERAVILGTYGPTLF